MKTTLLALAILLPSAALAADGAPSTFQTYCATCHGPEGRGDGIAASGMSPPPANFTDPKRLAQRSDADIVKTIGQGGASMGLSPVMPAWKGVLSDPEIKTLATYLRTLSPKK